MIIRQFKCLHCNELVVITDMEDKREKYCCIEHRKQYLKRQYYLKNKEQIIKYQLDRYKQVYQKKRVEVKETDKISKINGKKVYIIGNKRYYRDKYGYYEPISKETRRKQNSKWTDKDTALLWGYKMVDKLPNKEIALLLERSVVSLFNKLVKTRDTKDYFIYLYNTKYKL